MLSSNKSVKWAVTAIAVIAAMMLVSAAAQADIINVPGDQPTIQAGIDAAVNGDEVIVKDGVYTGEGNRDLDFGGKLITVRSENGPDNCIIDCQGTKGEPHRGFYFHNGETNEAVVDGFTITGGNAGLGGGMRNQGSSPTVQNCIFDGNRSGDSGGGMSNTEQSNPMVINCQFSNNSSAFLAGGMGNQIGSSPMVLDCVFDSNEAALGGGMFNRHAGTKPIVQDCTFVGNTATGIGGLLGDGGGILNFQFCEPIIDGCTFTGNEADQGAGINNDESQTNITGCTFSGNTASLSGGGIFNYGDTKTTLSDSLFCENDPDHIAGPFSDGGGNEFLDTCPAPACPWDLNDSGTIGILDLLTLLANWGPIPPGEGYQADLDCDGNVGILDLLRLLAAWGPCPCP